MIRRRVYKLPNGLTVSIDYGFDENDNFFLNGMRLNNKPKNKGEYFIGLLQVCDIYDRFLMN